MLWVHGCLDVYGNGLDDYCEHRLTFMAPGLVQEQVDLGKVLKTHIAFLNSYSGSLNFKDHCIS